MIKAINVLFSRTKNVVLMFIASLILVFIPLTVEGMHIMEGFLPVLHSILWTLIYIPFFILGLRAIQKIVKEDPRKKLLMAMAAAFVFILSSLKIPSVTGSCSHPTGVGLGTILFGPLAMSVIGLIVLIFQALLLAHGGITTLGANAFSMAVAGPFVAFGVYRLTRKFRLNLGVSIFLATFVAGLATYSVTSVQLALAFGPQAGGFVLALAKFMGIFVWTQLPLAISEGLLTVLMFNGMMALAKEELQSFELLKEV